MFFLKPARLVFCVIVVSAASLGGAVAGYYKPTTSDLDASIMQIDEKKYLGAKLDGEVPLIDGSGTQVPLASFLGKPLLVVLSYYTCDGSCSVINTILRDLLKDVSRVSPGEDFSILTLSFDTHDTPESTMAFREAIDVEANYKDNWSFATFKNEADLEAQTAKIGFKFFWSAQDKIFLHPGAFLFFSPEGRLIRILYPPEVDGGDVELAVLDAKQGQFRPQEIINFAISLCYSYNYKEGKYTLSIPIFVGFGTLMIGVTTLFGSILVYKRKHRGTKTQGDFNNADTA